MTAENLPLVSAIVPAYNAERFISRTLDSILAQTYQAFEVIVVDDGSTDRTAEIVDEYQRRDHRVKLLKQHNGGVSAARNLGIANAQGEFIAPVDADDLWYPTKLEKQIACFAQADAHLGLVYTWSAMVDEDDRLTGRWIASHQAGTVLLALICQNFIGNASAPLIKKAAIERVGCYNLELKIGNRQGAEDWDLYIKIAEHYAFAVVPEFLTAYRQVSGSMSRNFSAMEEFVAMVLGGVQRRNPSLPAQIFRWTKGEQYYNFSKTCRSGGEPVSSLSWLMRAVAADPQHLLRREFYRFLLTDLRCCLLGSEKKAELKGSGVTLSHLQVIASRALDGPGDFLQRRLKRLPEMKFTGRPGCQT
jgi:glycosyltransferase involved in cell wall biosynthesis